MAKHGALRVGIVLADAFTLSAFSLFLDHIRLAADEGDGSRPRNAQWEILSSDAEPIFSSCGLSVLPTARLSEGQHFDYLVVVGGLLARTQPITEAMARYIRESAAAGVTLVGLCTGTFILCRLNLMTGRKTCVSWYHYQDFVEEFPDQTLVADRIFLEDRDRITCAGGAGSADLAAFLIDRHLGPSLARKASQVLMFERSRSGSESQPHLPEKGEMTNGRLARALLLMEQNIAEPLPIGQIAKHLNISLRQLERLCQSVLGQSPAAVYRNIRLRYASWLLNASSRSITAIAQDAGFSDCAHFSRLFKACYGHSPSRQRSGSVNQAGELAGSRLYMQSPLRHRASPEHQMAL